MRIKWKIRNHGLKIINSFMLENNKRTVVNLKFLNGVWLAPYVWNWGPLKWKRGFMCGLCDWKVSTHNGCTQICKSQSCTTYSSAVFFRKACKIPHSRSITVKVTIMSPVYPVFPVIEVLHMYSEKSTFKYLSAVLIWIYNKTPRNLVLHTTAVYLPYFLQIWHSPLIMTPPLLRAAKYLTSQKSHISRCSFLHLQHYNMTFFGQIKY